MSDYNAAADYVLVKVANIEHPASTGLYVVHNTNSNRPLRKGIVESVGGRVYDDLGVGDFIIYDGTGALDNPENINQQFVHKNVILGYKS